MMRIGCKKVVTYVTVRYDRKDVEFFGIIRDRVVFTVKKAKKWEEVFQPYVYGVSDSDIYLKEVITYRK